MRNQKKTFIEHFVMFSAVVGILLGAFLLSGTLTGNVINSKSIIPTPYGFGLFFLIAGGMLLWFRIKDFEHI